jgi:heme exporter protein C
MSFAYLFLFGSLWLVRIRAEVWKRRAIGAALKAAAT